MECDGVGEIVSLLAGTEGCRRAGSEVWYTGQGSAAHQQVQLETQILRPSGEGPAELVTALHGKFSGSSRR